MHQQGLFLQPEKVTVAIFARFAINFAYKLILLTMPFTEHHMEGYLQF